MVENFVFHKGYDGVWSAVKRENYFDLFNDFSKIKYRGSNPEHLAQLIEKTGGNEENLEKLADALW